MSATWRTSIQTVAFGAGLLVAAAITAFAVGHPGLALVALAAAGAVVLFIKPDLVAVLAVALLPYPLDLPTGLPIDLSPTDALIALALAGWLVAGLLRPRREPRIHVLRSLGIPLLAYGAAMALTFVVHPSVPGAVTMFQRVGLVVGGLLLGAGLVRIGRLRLSLEIYLASASLLAVAAVVDSGDAAFLGVQKNPAGGFILAALFIAILVKPSPRWLLYTPVLAVGLLATQSRGALIGALVGIAVGIVVVRWRGRVRLMFATTGVLGLIVVAYSYLPAGAKERLLRTSGSNDNAIQDRTSFQADALDHFHSAPWTGVGIGNYTGGPRLPGILDPHQVVLFQLAEGGIPLLVAFSVLVLGGAFVVLRHSRSSPLALAALTVQVATVIHAMTDVYWVRGTPTPAWFLIGAALAVAIRAKDQVEPSRRPIEAAPVG